MIKTVILLVILLITALAIAKYMINLVVTTPEGWRRNASFSLFIFNFLFLIIVYLILLLFS